MVSSHRTLMNSVLLPLITYLSMEQAMMAVVCKEMAREVNTTGVGDQAGISGSTTTIRLMETTWEVTRLAISVPRRTTLS